MDITESSIQKFFDYLCSKDEASLVAKYLQENQEAYNSILENEWKSCENIYVEADEYFEIRQHVWDKAFKKRKSHIVKIAISIAACFILFLCTNTFFKQKVNVKNTLSDNNLKMAEAWNIRVNATDKESWVHLEDGSDVRLQKNSLIKYQSLTQTNRRDIYLEGEAFFKVAKNKKKPFTVWASGITTTALGTQFSVAKNKDKLIVKLFEGKVVIECVDTLNHWRQKKVYLIPGMEFVYDCTSALFVVRPFKPYSNQEKKTLPDYNNESYRTIKNANWYMFNNQPLVQVFKQLEEIYNVHIEYKEKDFERVYFIGKFDKNDSVADVLKNITLLKKLKITQAGNIYTIRK